jgi:hypothetical protein
MGGWHQTFVNKSATGHKSRSETLFWDDNYEIIRKWVVIILQDHMLSDDDDDESAFISRYM